MELVAVGCKEYFAPEVFSSDRPEYQEDRATCFLRFLREQLAEKGVNLVHCDDVAPKDTWGYLFVDHNGNYLDWLEQAEYRGRLFLIVFESALIQPGNWLTENRIRYTAVFSWENPGKNRNIEGNNPINFFWPNPLSLAEKPISFLKREKLCVLMAANKWKRRPGELYTERFRAILWFMEHHPEDFDLYGYDWDISTAKRIIEHVRNVYRSFEGT